MPYCAECGVELDETDRFCRECGHETDPASSPDPSPQTRSRGETNRGSAPEAEPEPAVPADQSTGFTTGQKVVFAGAAVTVVGAFLPWITIGGLGVSKSGIDADGVLTLAFGLVAGGGAVVRWGRWARVAVAALGLLTAGIGVVYIADPLAGSGVTSQLARAAIEPASGLYVTALGGIVMLAGPLLDYA